MKREKEKDGLMKTDLVMTFSCGKMKRRVETTKSRVLGETRVAIEQHLGLHKITIPGGGYQPLSGRRASKRISHLSRIISELLLSVYHSLSLNLSNGNLPPTLYSLCNTMIFPSDWKKVGTRKKERKKKKRVGGGRERERRRSVSKLCKRWEIRSKVVKQISTGRRWWWGGTAVTSGTKIIKVSFFLTQ